MFSPGSSSGKNVGWASLGDNDNIDNGHEDEGEDEDEDEDSTAGADARRNVEGREIAQGHAQYALTYGMMLGIRVSTQLDAWEGGR